MQQETFILQSLYFINLVSFFSREELFKPNTMLFFIKSQRFSLYDIFELFLNFLVS